MSCLSLVILPVLAPTVVCSVRMLVYRLKREGFEEAGELVVRYAIENGGLVAFERLWRQHFLDSMKPGFLPKGWSVDHSHDQLLCLERNVLRCVTDNSKSPDSVNSTDL